MSPSVTQLVPRRRIQPPSAIKFTAHPAGDIRQYRNKAVRCFHGIGKHSRIFHVIVHHLIAELANLSPLIS